MKKAFNKSGLDGIFGTITVQSFTWHLTTACPPPDNNPNSGATSWSPIASDIAVPTDVGSGTADGESDI